MIDSADKPSRFCRKDLGAFDMGKTQVSSHNSKFDVQDSPSLLGAKHRQSLPSFARFTAASHEVLPVPLSEPVSSCQFEPLYVMAPLPELSHAANSRRDSCLTRS
jgi:hypothetical protein